MKAGWRNGSIKHFLKKMDEGSEDTGVVSKNITVDANPHLLNQFHLRKPFRALIQDIFFFPDLLVGYFCDLHFKCSTHSVVRYTLKKIQAQLQAHI